MPATPKAASKPKRAAKPKTEPKPKPKPETLHDEAGNYVGPRREA